MSTSPCRSTIFADRSANRSDPLSYLAALTGNSISLLSSLVPLETLTNLRYLSLNDNPVRKENHYREFAIWKVAKGQLHVLDFQRVKDAERELATELFLTPAPDRQPNALAATLSSSTSTNANGGSKTFVPGQEAGFKSASRSITDEDKEKIRAAILKAESSEEIQRLEKMLAEGIVPTDRDL